MMDLAQELDRITEEAKKNSSVEITRKTCHQIDQVLCQFLQQPGLRFCANIHGLRNTLHALSQVAPQLVVCDELHDLCHQLFLVCAAHILGVDWQRQSNGKEEEKVKAGFCASLSQCFEAMQSNGMSHWFLMLQFLMINHWTHPVLAAMMLGKGLDETRALQYLGRGEYPDLLRLRIQMLTEGGCDDLALNLCNWCVRHPQFSDDLFMRLKQLSLLYRQGRQRELFHQCVKMRCCTSVPLLQHIVNKRNYSVSMQLAMARMLFLEDWCNPNSFCCTRELLKIWLRIEWKVDRSHRKMSENIMKVASLHGSTWQLVTLVDVVRQQFGTYFLQVCCEVLLIALKIDTKGYLDAKKKYNPSRAAYHQSRLNYTCFVLSCLFRNHTLKMRKIAALTALSLEPTRELFCLVESLYQICVDRHDINQNDLHTDESSSSEDERPAVQEMEILSSDDEAGTSENSSEKTSSKSPATACAESTDAQKSDGHEQMDVSLEGSDTCKTLQTKTETSSEKSDCQSEGDKMDIPKESRHISTSVELDAKTSTENIDSHSNTNLPAESHEVSSVVREKPENVCESSEKDNNSSNASAAVNNSDAQCPAVTAEGGFTEKPSTPNGLPDCIIDLKRNCACIKKDSNCTCSSATAVKTDNEISVDSKMVVTAVKVDSENSPAAVKVYNESSPTVVQADNTSSAAAKVDSESSPAAVKVDSESSPAAVRIDSESSPAAKVDSENSPAAVKIDSESSPAAKVDCEISPAVVKVDSESSPAAVKVDSENSASAVKVASENNIQVNESSGMCTRRKTSQRRASDFGGRTVSNDSNLEMSGQKTVPEPVNGDHSIFSEKQNSRRQRRYSAGDLKNMSPVVRLTKVTITSQNFSTYCVSAEEAEKSMVSRITHHEEQNKEMKCKGSENKTNTRSLSAGMQSLLQHRFKLPPTSNNADSNTSDGTVKTTLSLEERLLQNQSIVAQPASTPTTPYEQFFQEWVSKKCNTDSVQKLNINRLKNSQPSVCITKLSDGLSGSKTYDNTQVKTLERTQKLKDKKDDSKQALTEESVPIQSAEVDTTNKTVENKVDIDSSEGDKLSAKIGIGKTSDFDELQLAKKVSSEKRTDFSKCFEAFVFGSSKATNDIDAVEPVGKQEQDAKVNGIEGKAASSSEGLSKSESITATSADSAQQTSVSSSKSEPTFRSSFEAFIKQSLTNVKDPSESNDSSQDSLSSGKQQCGSGVENAEKVPHHITPAEYTKSFEEFLKQRIKEKGSDNAEQISNSHSADGAHQHSSESDRDGSSGDSSPKKRKRSRSQTKESPKKRKGKKRKSKRDRSREKIHSSPKSHKHKKSKSDKKKSLKAGHPKGIRKKLRTDKEKTAANYDLSCLLDLSDSESSGSGSDSEWTPQREDADKKPQLSQKRPELTTLKDSPKSSVKHRQDEPDTAKEANKETTVSEAQLVSHSDSNTDCYSGKAVGASSSQDKPDSSVANKDGSDVSGKQTHHSSASSGSVEHPSSTESAKNSPDKLNNSHSEVRAKIKKKSLKCMDKKLSRRKSSWEKYSKIKQKHRRKLIGKEDHKSLNVKGSKKQDHDKPPSAKKGKYKHHDLQKISSVTAPNGSLCSAKKPVRIERHMKTRTQTRCAVQERDYRFDIEIPGVKTETITAIIRVLSTIRDKLLNPDQEWRLLRYMCVDRMQRAGFYYDSVYDYFIEKCSNYSDVTKVTVIGEDRSFNWKPPQSLSNPAFTALSDQADVKTVSTSRKTATVHTQTTASRTPIRDWLRKVRIIAAAKSNTGPRTVVPLHKPVLFRTAPEKSKFVPVMSRPLTVMTSVHSNQSTPVAVQNKTVIRGDMAVSGKISHSSELPLPQNMATAIAAQTLEKLSGSVPVSRIVATNTSQSQDFSVSKNAVGRQTSIDEAQSGVGTTNGKHTEHAGSTMLTDTKHLHVISARQSTTIPSISVQNTQPVTAQGLVPSVMASATITVLASSQAAGTPVIQPQSHLTPAQTAHLTMPAMRGIHQQPSATVTANALQHSGQQIMRSGLPPPGLRLPNVLPSATSSASRIQVPDISSANYLQVTSKTAPPTITSVQKTLGQVTTTAATSLQMSVLPCPSAAQAASQNVLTLAQQQTISKNVLTPEQQQTDAAGKVMFAKYVMLPATSLPNQPPVSTVSQPPSAQEQALLSRYQPIRPAVRPQQTPQMSTRVVGINVMQPATSATSLHPVVASLQPQTQNASHVTSAGAQMMSQAGQPSAGHVQQQQQHGGNVRTALPTAQSSASSQNPQLVNALTTLFLKKMLQNREAASTSATPDAEASCSSSDMRRRQTSAHILLQQLAKMALKQRASQSPMTIPHAKNVNTTVGNNTARNHSAVTLPQLVSQSENSFSQPKGQMTQQLLQPSSSQITNRQQSGGLDSTYILQQILTTSPEILARLMGSTSQHTEIASQLTETASQPAETASQPAETASQLTEIASQMKASSQQSSTTCQSKVTTSSPTETVSQLDRTRQAAETACQITDTERLLTETVCQLSDITRQTAYTNNQPANIVSFPMHTTENSVTQISALQQSESVQPTAGEPENKPCDSESQPHALPERVQKQDVNEEGRSQLNGAKTEADIEVKEERDPVERQQILNQDVVSSMQIMHKYSMEHSQTESTHSLVASQTGNERCVLNLAAEGKVESIENVEAARDKTDIPKITSQESGLGTTVVKSLLVPSETVQRIQIEEASVKINRSEQPNISMAVNNISQSAVDNEALDLFKLSSDQNRIESHMDNHFFVTSTPSEASRMISDRFKSDHEDHKLGDSIAELRECGSSPSLASSPDLDTSTEWDDSSSSKVDSSVVRQLFTADDEDSSSSFYGWEDGVPKNSPPAGGFMYSPGKEGRDILPQESKHDVSVDQDIVFHVDSSFSRSVLNLTPPLAERESQDTSQDTHSNVTGTYSMDKATNTEETWSDVEHAENSEDAQRFYQLESGEIVSMLVCPYCGYEDCICQILSREAELSNMILDEANKQFLASDTNFKDGHMMSSVETALKEAETSRRCVTVKVPTGTVSDRLQGRGISPPYRVMMVPQSKVSEVMENLRRDKDGQDISQQYAADGCSWGRQAFDGERPAKRWELQRDYGTLKFTPVKKGAKGYKFFNRYSPVAVHSDPELSVSRSSIEQSCMQGFQRRGTVNDSVRKSTTEHESYSVHADNKKVKTGSSKKFDIRHCNICNLTFSTRKALVLHKERECPTKADKSKQENMNTNAGEPNARDRAAGLNNNVQEKGKDPSESKYSHSCPLCGRVFMYLSSLEEHLTNHEDEYCDEPFIQSEQKVRKTIKKTRSEIVKKILKRNQLKGKDKSVSGKSGESPTGKSSKLKAPPESTAGVATQGEGDDHNAAIQSSDKSGRKVYPKRSKKRKVTEVGKIKNKYHEQPSLETVADSKTDSQASETESISSDSSSKSQLSNSSRSRKLDGRSWMCYVCQKEMFSQKSLKRHLMSVHKLRLRSALVASGPTANWAADALPIQSSSPRKKMLSTRLQGFSLQSRRRIASRRPNFSSVVAKHRLREVKSDSEVMSTSSDAADFILGTNHKRESKGNAGLIEESIESVVSRVQQHNLQSSVHKSKGKKSALAKSAKRNSMSLKYIQEHKSVAQATNAPSESVKSGVNYESSHQTAELSEADSVQKRKRVFSTRRRNESCIVKMEDGKKKFICDICGGIYSRIDSVSRHKRNNHKDVLKKSPPVEERKKSSSPTSLGKKVSSLKRARKAMRKRHLSPTSSSPVSTKKRNIVASVQQDSAKKENTNVSEGVISHQLLSPDSSANVTTTSTPQHVLQENASMQLADSTSTSSTVHDKSNINSQVAQHVPKETLTMQPADSTSTSEAVHDKSNINPKVTQHVAKENTSASKTVSKKANSNPKVTDTNQTESGSKKATPGKPIYIKPFKCHVCDVAYTRNSSLNLHLRSVHELDVQVKTANHKWDCYVCHEQFDSSVVLKTHFAACHLNIGQVSQPKQGADAGHSANKTAASASAVATPQKKAKRKDVIADNSQQDEPPVSQPSLSQMVPPVSQPSLSQMVPQESQPSLSQMVPQESQPSLSQMGPPVSQPSLSQMVPQESQPSLSQMAPQGSQPSLSQMVPQESQPSLSQIVPPVSQPSLSQMVPPESQPTPSKSKPPSKPASKKPAVSTPKPSGKKSKEQKSEKSPEKSPKKSPIKAVCNICGRAFSQDYNMRRHKKGVHGVVELCKSKSVSTVGSDNKQQSPGSAAPTRVSDKLNSPKSSPKSGGALKTRQQSGSLKTPPPPSGGVPSRSRKDAAPVNSFDLANMDLGADDNGDVGNMFDQTLTLEEEMDVIQSFLKDCRVPFLEQNSNSTYNSGMNAIDRLYLTDSVDDEGIQNPSAYTHTAPADTGDVDDGSGVLMVQSQPSLNLPVLKKPVELASLSMTNMSKQSSAVCSEDTEGTSAQLSTELAAGIRPSAFRPVKKSSQADQPVLPTASSSADLASVQNATGSTPVITNCTGLGTPEVLPLLMSAVTGVVGISGAFTITPAAGTVDSSGYWTAQPTLQLGEGGIKMTDANLLKLDQTAANSDSTLPAAVPQSGFINQDISIVPVSVASTSDGDRNVVQMTAPGLMQIPMQAIMQLNQSQPVVAAATAAAAAENGFSVNNNGNTSASVQACEPDHEVMEIMQCNAVTQDMTSIAIQTSGPDLNDDDLEELMSVGNEGCEETRDSVTVSGQPATDTVNVPNQPASHLIGENGNASSQLSTNASLQQSHTNSDSVTVTDAMSAQQLSELCEAVPSNQQSVFNAASALYNMIMSSSGCENTTQGYTSASWQPLPGQTTTSVSADQMAYHKPAGNMQSVVQGQLNEMAASVKDSSKEKGTAEQQPANQQTSLTQLEASSLQPFSMTDTGVTVDANTSELPVIPNSAPQENTANVNGQLNDTQNLLTQNSALMEAMAVAQLPGFENVIGYWTNLLSESQPLFLPSENASDAGMANLLTNQQLMPSSHITDSPDKLAPPQNTKINNSPASTQFSASAISDQMFTAQNHSESEKSPKKTPTKKKRSASKAKNSASSSNQSNVSDPQGSVSGTVDGDKPPPPWKTKAKCDVCNLVLCSPYNVKRHKRNVHKINEDGSALSTADSGNTQTVASYTGENITASSQGAGELSSGLLTLSPNVNTKKKKKSSSGDTKPKKIKTDSGKVSRTKKSKAKTVPEKSPAEHSVCDVNETLTNPSSGEKDSTVIVTDSGSELLNLESNSCAVINHLGSVQNEQLLSSVPTSFPAFQPSDSTLGAQFALSFANSAVAASASLPFVHSDMITQYQSAGLIPQQSFVCTSQPAAIPQPQQQQYSSVQYASVVNNMAAESINSTNILTSESLPLNYQTGLSNSAVILSSQPDAGLQNALNITGGHGEGNQHTVTQNTAVLYSSGQIEGATGTNCDPQQQQRTVLTQWLQSTAPVTMSADTDRSQQNCDNAIYENSSSTSSHPPQQPRKRRISTDVDLSEYKSKKKNLTDSSDAAELNVDNIQKPTN